MQYPFRYLDQFRGYEGEAREAGRGLWGATPDAAVTSRTSAADDTPKSEQIVYVTKTGTKYHREGCRYLARSQIPIALKNVGSHTACSVCNPPTLRDQAATVRDATSAPATVQAAPQAAPAQPAASGRCQALTKKGTQCSRRAQTGSKYCWQHQH